MINTNTGGQAFPCYERCLSGLEMTDGGMTLRDYFAAKAMHAFISGAPGGTSFGVDNRNTNSNYAVAAYAMADAMLKAREQ